MVFGSCINPKSVAACSFVGCLCYSLNVKAATLHVPLCLTGNHNVPCFHDFQVYMHLLVLGTLQVVQSNQVAVQASPAWASTWPCASAWGVIRNMRVSLQAAMPHDSSAAGRMPAGRGPPLFYSMQPSPGLQPSGLGKPRSCPGAHAPFRLQQLQQQQQLMAQQQYALQQEQMMMQQQVGKYNLANHNLLVVEICH